MPGPSDEVSSITPQPEAAPAPAPVAESPIPEVAAPAQADQAEAHSAPAAEPSLAAGAEPAPPTAEPTLLDKFDDKKAAPAAEPEKKPDAAVEAKPAGEKPADADKVPEGEAAVEPVAEAAPLPEVDYFAAETGIKLPETIVLDDTTRGELKTALDTLRTNPIKGAQALVDMHAKQMADFAQQTEQKAVDNQWAAFRETKSNWVKEVMADPVLGGAGHDTAMAQVAVARDNLASTAKPGTPRYVAELKEFNDALRNTGAGDNPAILRFMHNAARFVREADLPPPNPKPPADLGKNPNAKKGALVYDNPTSQPT